MLSGTYRVDKDGTVALETIGERTGVVPVSCTDVSSRLCGNTAAVNNDTQ